MVKGIATNFDDGMNPNDSPAPFGYRVYAGTTTDTPINFVVGVDCPAGVGFVHACAIGGGAGPGVSTASGSGGGELRWRNNIIAPPGATLTGIAGHAGANNGTGGQSNFAVVLVANGGLNGTSSTAPGLGGSGGSGDGGGNGGAGGVGGGSQAAGGGAGGYTGNGGDGGSSVPTNGLDGQGGGGGGGGGAGTATSPGGRGGGVSPFGQLPSGLGGASATSGAASPGGDVGLLFGGGAGYGSGNSVPALPGAVCIIWGPNRYFPDHAC